MAKVTTPKLRFKHSGNDAAGVRVRLSAAESDPSYDTPYDQVAMPAQDPDGFRRIALTDLPKIAGKEGTYDVDVTVVDAAGNESDFLQINSANFDLSPPEAPTEGSVD